ncbi:hypothetical protein PHAVU_009G145600 [Phaseolus vulgaris]|uniref:F-box domain-containing protein n=1 Tax=Phaseolus vulgaris TaxID=3885 RepID=V7AZM6_PHAVU|nr:hypothetical protein PHAVU_009G145600g [Phaseolus vulgaris]ESW09661.1 hypothetical protein PHAVU_009G145600g [Phaseolus vulgaris]
MKSGGRKRKKTKSDAPPPEPFNEDLTIEILLKLPIKSVVRFKCLSKSWFSLISDPQFARIHFDAAAAPTYKLFNLVNDSEAYSVDIESALCDDSAHAVSNIPVPSRSDKYGDSLSVAGSCRGFLLLQCLFTDFVVWNPSTGIKKQIYYSNWSPHHLSGIGYDSLDDDFVVVTVTLRANKTVVRYFCLKTQCWSCVEYGVSYAQHKLELRNGEFLNGALHWIVKSADNLGCVLIGFDVREKRFLEIPLPNHLAILPKRYEIYYLKVMGEYLSLCLVVRNQAPVIEIWSMKECKVDSLWTKTFVFSSNFGCFLSLIYPLCFTKNGEILAFNGNETLVKITENGKLRYGQRQSRLDFMSCGVYRESFLSLPSNK